MRHGLHATEPGFAACKAGRMSAYKVVNLMDIDNSVGDRAPGLEGRFARKQLESRDLGVSHWRYEPNVRAPASHRHGEQEEAYVVISGSGRVRLGDDIVDLHQWDVVRVAPEVVRGFESGPDGLEMIAVGGPRPEEGDGQLAEDPWPDES
jgi:mannose-6-phosphate isomerase-like protein (cupin superfamily)